MHIAAVWDSQQHNVVHLGCVQLIMAPSLQVWGLATASFPGLGIACAIFVQTLDSCTYWCLKDAACSVPYQSPPYALPLLLVQSTQYATLSCAGRTATHLCFTALTPPC